MACDDPARMVGTAVLLPMLRERLESKAWDYHNRDILQAQQRVCLAITICIDCHNRDVLQAQRKVCLTISTCLSIHYHNGEDLGAAYSLTASCEHSLNMMKVMPRGV